MRTRRHLRLAAAALIVLLALAGCGFGEDDDEPTPTRAAESTASPAAPVAGTSPAAGNGTPDAATPVGATAPETAAGDGFVVAAQGDARRSGRQPGLAPVGEPELLWETDLSGPVRAAPVLAQGLLLVETDGDDGALVAVDARTGAERWRQNGASGATPAVDGDRVFAGMVGAFRAFDLASGEPLWSFATRTDAWSSAVVAGGAIFVCDLTNQLLYALDAATGRQLWNLRGVDRPPAAADGLVFAAGPDALYAVDAASGSVRWLEYMDAVGYAVVADDGVYVVAKRLGAPARYDLIALDRAGVERWRIDLGTLPPSSPVRPLDGALVLVAAGTSGGAVRLLTLDAADGSLQSSVDTGVAAVSELAIVGDSVCYTAADRSVRIVEAATGQATWRFDGLEGTLTAPIVADGMVFVGSESPEGGKIVALGATPTSAATPAAPAASPVGG